MFSLHLTPKNTSSHTRSAQKPLQIILHNPSDLLTLAMPFAIGFRIPDVIAIQPVDEHVASQIEEVDGRRRHRHFGDLISLSNHDDFVRSRSLAPCDPCSLQCRLGARKEACFANLLFFGESSESSESSESASQERGFARGLRGPGGLAGGGDPPPGGLSGGLRTRQYRWSRLTVEQGSFFFCVGK